MTFNPILYSLMTYDFGYDEIIPLRLLLRNAWMNRAVCLADPQFLQNRWRTGIFRAWRVSKKRFARSRSQKILDWGTPGAEDWWSSPGAEGKSYEAACRLRESSSQKVRCYLMQATWLLEILAMKPWESPWQVCVSRNSIELYIIINPGRQVIRLYRQF